MLHPCTALPRHPGECTNANSEYEHTYGICTYCDGRDPRGVDACRSPPRGDPRLINTSVYRHRSSAIHQHPISTPSAELYDSISFPSASRATRKKTTRDSGITVRLTGPGFSSLAFINSRHTRFGLVGQILLRIAQALFAAFINARAHHVRLSHIYCFTLPCVKYAMALHYHPSRRYSRFHCNPLRSNFTSFPSCISFSFQAEETSPASTCPPRDSPRAQINFSLPTLTGLPVHKLRSAREVKLHGFSSKRLPAPLQ
ncbi:hypothetical protein P280DRAFT_180290 [Massarina eburnea CBS 473.64]|uniref:Uncharacterized protein n=1 Tax=Massarina eburnea CBS 473.64 TaxID=1395130 RepID=A0A6A6SAL1_9PLEO|nr:hypothetical protein P280DRAFT_180290 [Massarina eburnea CBS 473.64]